MEEEGLHQDFPNFVNMPFLAFAEFVYHHFPDAKKNYFETRTAFTRCRQILKTVKNVMDWPPVHTKMAHLLPADIENGRF